MRHRRGPEGTNRGGDLRIVGACFGAGGMRRLSRSQRLLREPPARHTGSCWSSFAHRCLLARKRRVARPSRAAMEADARQTDFCFYLSVILVGGLR
jgi:hypothetical protein